MIDTIVTLLTRGISAPDAGLLALRGSVGVFFAISGWHKLANAERHERLYSTLKDDKVPCADFMQWWVPAWELIAGTLVTFGLLTGFSALTLIIVCLVACACESAQKVAKYKPIDAADKLDDYLYLPEVLYTIMLAAVLMTGPGAWSLDALLFR